MENFKEYLVKHNISISEDNLISVGNDKKLIRDLTTKYIRESKLIGKRSEIEFVLFDKFKFINKFNYLVKYSCELDKVTELMFWELYYNRFKGRLPYNKFYDMMSKDPKKYQDRAFEILNINTETKVKQEDKRWVKDLVTNTITLLILVEYVNHKVTSDLPNATELDWKIVSQTPYILEIRNTLDKIIK